MTVTPLYLERAGFAVDNHPVVPALVSVPPNRDPLFLQTQRAREAVSRLTGPATRRAAAQVVQVVRVAGGGGGDLELAVCAHVHEIVGERPGLERAAGPALDTRRVVEGGPCGDALVKALALLFVGPCGDALVKALALLFVGFPFSLSLERRPVGPESLSFARLRGRDLVGCMSI